MILGFLSVKCIFFIFFRINLLSFVVKYLVMGRSLNYLGVVIIFIVNLILLLYWFKICKFL